MDLRNLSRQNGNPTRFSCFIWKIGERGLGEKVNRKKCNAKGIATEIRFEGVHIISDKIPKVNACVDTLDWRYQNAS